MLNPHILSEEVQSYIREHAQADPGAIALKGSPFAEVSASELAQQIEGFQKVQKKIPAWLQANAKIYFPEKLNLEQCSSAPTGAFKASLLRPHCSVLDLTGGFGVDSYYFAQVADSVQHCEINPKLSAIVAHNFKVLGLRQSRCYSGDGLAFLAQSEQHYDYIYADPSRRVNKQKVFRLEDCEPNMVAQQDLLFEKAEVLITKLAPLLDISLALHSLKAVKAVYVVSLDNDCKELLFVQEKGFQGNPQLHAVRLLPSGPQVFSFDHAQEKVAEPDFALPSKYLYDPDVAISKAGAFKSVATHYGLAKLHQHSHLYSSQTLVADFPGRIFDIVDVIPLSQFKKQNPLPKANVIAKNFPLKVDAIRKKFKIKDGGQDYLYFTSLFNQENVVIQAKRLH